MPIPERITPYHEKDPLDNLIDQLVAQPSASIESDLNRVLVASQIFQGIEKYRADASSLPTNVLQSEEHCSRRLGGHLEQAGYRRPPRCHAHAIVSGKHYEAARLRLTMAKLKIRIDDSDNGCWLPENTKATPHPAFPSAVPHSRIHRFNYYFWISASLRNISKEKFFRTKLRLISDQLQQGGLPKYVMLPKGVGLPQ